jgi:hypothetical protein
MLGEREGDGRGAESYDLEKAWPSTNHSILSGLGCDYVSRRKPGPLYIQYYLILSHTIFGDLHTYRARQALALFS